MLTKILVVYSTVVTTLLAAFTLAGSAAREVKTEFNGSTRSTSIASMFVSLTAPCAW